MDKVFRVGVVGATGRGNYGHGLDTAWLQVPQTSVVAVADANPEGRDKAVARLGCQQSFADYRQMMDQVRPDIVAVCPRWLDQHYSMIKAAAERGIHSYVEKPFCRDLAEADALVEACEMSHSRVGIAHPTRYAPAMATVRDLIASGAIGQLLELRGRGKEDHRGGAEDLWVLGSHILDMVLALGFQPDWCFAKVLQNGRPLEPNDVQEGPEGIGPLAGDAVQALYGVQHATLETPITFSFQSFRDVAGDPWRYALWLCGSRGLIEIQEGVLPVIRILRDASWNSSRGHGQWEAVSSAGIGEPEPLQAAKYRSRHQLAIEDLLVSIQEQREPLCGMYEGQKIVEMIAAVFASHRQGTVVQFPLSVRENPLANWQSRS